MSTNNEAWDDYWRQKGTENANCLPCANAEIDGVLEKWWHNFANQLGKKAQIVDFATGNGIVLQRILAKRRDVKAVGIDAANELPKPSGKYRLRSGINMEKTPFGNKSVDAITSQFGIEYGDLEKIVAETSRIIKPGGQICFIMHCKPGPIIAHNEPRLEGLKWALEEQKLPERALNWIKQRALVGNAIPPLFQSSPNIAAQKFGRGAVAHEFATAVLQSLMVGQNRRPEESLSMIADLESLAKNEMGRIRSLINAGVDDKNFASFCNRLRQADYDIHFAGSLEEFDQGADFGWGVRAQKIAD